MHNDSLEEQIRARAYALWEEDGSPEDRADEYWGRARTQIEAEEQERNQNVNPEAGPEANQQAAGTWQAAVK